MYKFPVSSYQILHSSLMILFSKRICWLLSHGSQKSIQEFNIPGKIYTLDYEADVSAKSGIRKVIGEDQLWGSIGEYEVMYGDIGRDFRTLELQE